MQSLPTTVGTTHCWLQYAVAAHALLPVAPSSSVKPSHTLTLATMVALQYVMLGDPNVYRVDAELLDFVAELARAIHAARGLESCTPSDVRLHLAEKRDYRAWFKTADPAVVAFQRDRSALPRDFVRDYLSRDTLQEPDERVQDLLPERYDQLRDEIQLFVLLEELPLTAASAPGKARKRRRLRHSDAILSSLTQRRASKCRKRCRLFGCSAHARRSGLCVAHGGGLECSMTGCSKEARARGKCRAHFSARQDSYVIVAPVAADRVRTRARTRLEAPTSTLVRRA